MVKCVTCGKKFGKLVGTYPHEVGGELCPGSPEQRVWRPDALDGTPVEVVIKPKEVSMGAKRLAERLNEEVTQLGKGWRVKYSGGAYCNVFYGRPSDVGKALRCDLGRLWLKALCGGYDGIPNMKDIEAWRRKQSKAL